MTVSHSQNVFKQPRIPQKRHFCTHIFLVSLSTGQKHHSKVHQKHASLKTQKRVTCRFSFRCACEHTLKEIQVCSFCATSTTSNGQVAASVFRSSKTTDTSIKGTWAYAPTHQHVTWDSHSFAHCTCVYLWIHGVDLREGGGRTCALERE